jgi:hypothetical protein
MALSTKIMLKKTADRTRQEQNNGKIIQLLSGPQWTSQISISYQNNGKICLVCFRKFIFLETIFFSFLYLITIQKSNQRKVNSNQ